VNALRLSLQILLPLLVVGGGFMIARGLSKRAAQPTVADAPKLPPLVRAAGVASIDVRLDVATQGTVEPFRTVDLTSQVGGRILSTADTLRAGGMFAAGEVLATIDASDFEFAIVQQEAAVARAELRLLQETAEGAAAVTAWQQLEGGRQAEPLVARVPQQREAAAALAAAKAQLAKSRLDLDRTQVRAPFGGRVKSVGADVGQVVQPGQRLAVLFDGSAVEVRLPLPLTDAAFVDLPFAAGSIGGEVTLTSEFGGSRHTWVGTVNRVEGEIDRKSRQLTVVAVVKDHAAGSEGKPPLLVGMFVQAVLHGRASRGTLAVPRAALRADNVVWSIDAEERLRRRPVEVLRAEADRVLLRSGLVAGERVCLSELDAMTDGMKVRVAEATGTGGNGAANGQAPKGN
jgi:RND family efflux transporter MFP subunit